MKTFKFYSLFFFFVTSFLIKGNSQSFTRKILNFPDIPGYKTLKCDFHMHTVFSDGLVWPTVRVMEAWSDGLDVIAITDHLGNTVKNRVNDSTYNRNYDIAKPVADKLGIILIRGTEITRKSPFGHLNALFVSDLKSIDKDDGKDALKEASKQGAFITWNHPGWRMPNEIPVWDSIHEDLFKSGLINGMEVVNYQSYYPLVFSWAKEKNITLMSGSDIHDPESLEFNASNDECRPIELVFAKDTSQASIKDALLKHRTVIYYKNMLFGSEEFLKPLFNSSVVVLNSEIIIDADSKNDYWTYIKIKNNSSVDFEMELVDADKELSVKNKIRLKANEISLIDLKPLPKNLKGNKEYVLKYKVKNLFKGPDDCIIIEIPVKVKYI